MDSWDTGGSSDPGSGYDPGSPGYDPGGSTPYPGFDQPQPIDPSQMMDPSNPQYQMLMQLQSDPNLSDYLNQLNSSGGGLGGMSGLLQSLGILDKNGNLNGLALASLLGPAAGAFLNYKSVGKATNQMTGAINSANDQVKSILGGAQGMYAPYQQAGQGALTNLQGLGFHPLAPQYKPLGSGAAMTLGQMAKGK